MHLSLYTVLYSCNSIMINIYKMLITIWVYIYDDKRNNNGSTQYASFAFIDNIKCTYRIQNFSVELGLYTCEHIRWTSFLPRDWTSIRQGNNVQRQDKHYTCRCTEIKNNFKNYKNLQYNKTDQHIFSVADIHVLFLY